MPYLFLLACNQERSPMTDPTIDERVAEFRDMALDERNIGRHWTFPTMEQREGMKKALPIITALLAERDKARARVEELMPLVKWPRRTE